MASFYYLSFCLSKKYLRGNLVALLTQDRLTLDQESRDSVWYHYSLSFAFFCLHPASTLSPTVTGVLHDTFSLFQMQFWFSCQ